MVNIKELITSTIKIEKSIHEKLSNFSIIDSKNLLLNTETYNDFCKTVNYIIKIVTNTSS